MFFWPAAGHLQCATRPGQQLTCHVTLCRQHTRKPRSGQKRPVLLALTTSTGCTQVNDRHASQEQALKEALHSAAFLLSCFLAFYRVSDGNYCWLVLFFALLFRIQTWVASARGQANLLRQLADICLSRCLQCSFTPVYAFWTLFRRHQRHIGTQQLRQVLRAGASWQGPRGSRVGAECFPAVCVLPDLQGIRAEVSSSAPRPLPPGHSLPAKTGVWPLKSAATTSRVNCVSLLCSVKLSASNQCRRTHSPRWHSSGLVAAQQSNRSAQAPCLSCARKDGKRSAARQPQHQQRQAC
jgi:hypothetical protein